jgi:hypothetical protein
MEGLMCSLQTQHQKELQAHGWCRTWFHPWQANRTQELQCQIEACDGGHLSNSSMPILRYLSSLATWLLSWPAPSWHDLWSIPCGPSPASGPLCSPSPGLLHGPSPACSVVHLLACSMVHLLAQSVVYLLPRPAPWSISHVCSW